MYLTRHSDYTMRLLVHLAVQSAATATIRDIADHYGISRNHLMQVANRAVQAGYVAASRGRGGGLKLAKPPSEIGVGEVLRATEDSTLVECFDPPTNRCPIAGGCGLRPVLKEALDAYYSVLDRYTLADIINRRTLLVTLLGLKSA